MFTAVHHLEAAFKFESLTAALGVPGKLRFNLQLALYLAELAS